MLATAPACVVLNLAGGEIVARLKIPLYFDSLGTVIAAILLGPLPAALTGLGTNVVWGVSGRYTALPFGITAFVIGLLAGHSSQLRNDPPAHEQQRGASNQHRRLRVGEPAEEPPTCAYQDSRGRNGCGTVLRPNFPPAEF